MGYLYLNEVSHRFVQVSFTGAGSFVECGHIFVGKRINLPQNNISIGSFSYSYEDRSEIRQNRYGQKFIDELPMIKSLGGSIEFCTKDEQETLDDMFARHGKHEPLWMIIDKDSEAFNDGATKLSIYGYLDKVPSWSAAGGRTYTTSLSMDEVV
jgi:hypothetical protein